MRLEVRGQPLHTRALNVTLSQRDERRLEARGYVLDLRKCGVVPVAADLQGPGVIHHMLIDAVVDPASRTLEEIVARQPNVAFEPSAITGGESCRDPIGRIEALRGARLDEGYAQHLSGAIGGPRGCSHILTLAQLLGSTVRWALDHDEAAPRRAGERIFRRDVILDGHQPDGTNVEVAIQLTDLHFAPSSLIAPPMARFGTQHEVRSLAQIDLSRIALSGLEICERRRAREDLDTAPWAARPEIGGELVGQSVMRGISGELLKRVAAAPDDAPIYDALLMLAPTMIQCFAAMSEPWLQGVLAADTLIGMGGIPDSCYMWRRDGALHRSRRPGDPMPSLSK